MVTLNGSTPNYIGQSSDDKPTNVPDNTIFLELDTGDFYYYIAEDELWVKVGG